MRQLTSSTCCGVPGRLSQGTTFFMAVMPRWLVSCPVALWYGLPDVFHRSINSCQVCKLRNEFRSCVPPETFFIDSAIQVSWDPTNTGISQYDQHCASLKLGRARLICIRLRFHQNYGWVVGPVPCQDVLFHDTDGAGLSASGYNLPLRL